MVELHRLGAIAHALTVSRSVSDPRYKGFCTSWNGGYAGDATQVDFIVYVRRLPPIPEDAPCRIYIKPPLLVQLVHVQAYVCCGHMFKDV